MVRRAVVTGGAGFLGSHLCERLLEEGYEVMCLDNFLTGAATNVDHLLEHERFRLVRADVSDFIHVVGPVDAVLHFASPASPIDYLQIHTLKVGSIGTLHRWVWPRRRVPVSCSRRRRGLRRPAGAPAAGKLLGQRQPGRAPRRVRRGEAVRRGLTVAYRQTHGVDTAIVRIFNTFGPRMRPNDGRAIPTFIRQALNNEPITVAGDGSQTRSVCYVDDLIEGIIRMVRSDLAGPINLGNPREMSVLELAEWIRELAGSRSPIEFIKRPQDDPTVRQPDISRARTTLGWEPTVAVEDGLKKTIEWFREREELIR